MDMNKRRCGGADSNYRLEQLKKEKLMNYDKCNKNRVKTDLYIPTLEVRLCRPLTGSLLSITLTDVSEETICERVGKYVDKYYPGWDVIGMN